MVGATLSQGVFGVRPGLVGGEPVRLVEGPALGYRQWRQPEPLQWGVDVFSGDWVLLDQVRADSLASPRLVAICHISSRFLDEICFRNGLPTKIPSLRRELQV